MDKYYWIVITSIDSSGLSSLFALSIFEYISKTYNRLLVGSLWLLNIAMENGPFIDDLPIKNDDFPWLC